MTAKGLGRNKMLTNQLHTYEQSHDFYTFPYNLLNWKSVSNVYSNRKGPYLDETKRYLRKYFINHMSIIDEHCKKDNFIDKQTFERILRSSDISINDNYLESLWNSCQPTMNGISYDIFLQHFAPSQLENKPNSIDSSQNNPLSSNQCQILNYTTRISHIVKKYWQNLKDEFFVLDRYGRLFITIDQAINLMKKYYFPLNDKQQCELALLFSTKSNGQFNYFDFMQHFSNQSSPKNVNRNIFSRSTHMIQSKQSWTFLPVTVDGILNRIRSQTIHNYGNIYRMFKTIDKSHHGYLTKFEFKQLLKLFDIHLDEDELYHVMSQIDRNQDGVISYNELYYSLIIEAL